MSLELNKEARDRAYELGLEGNMSLYIRSLIHQDLHHRDYWERMKMNKDKQ